MLPNIFAIEKNITFAVLIGLSWRLMDAKNICLS
jgi:hypothetical protein